MNYFVVPIILIEYLIGTTTIIGLDIKVKLTICSGVCIHMLISIFLRLFRLLCDLLW